MDVCGICGRNGFSRLLRQVFERTLEVAGQRLLIHRHFFPFFTTHPQFPQSVRSLQLRIRALNPSPNRVAILKTHSFPRTTADKQPPERF
jgi:hypothetical protein